MMSAKFNVLLLGSGGREHSIYQALKKSPLLNSIIVSPGNGGIPLNDKRDIPLNDFSKVLDFCKKEKINFTVIGPEEPLVNGIVDFLGENGISCFGPSKFCARIEGYKYFAKKIMEEMNIPTAQYRFFDDYKSSVRYLKEIEYPVVVKYDGLAAGKGVTIAFDFRTAEKALIDIFKEKIFGDETSVIIEEFLEGEECSVFGICDGQNVLPLLPAQDHKHLDEGDKGPNTGGMGAYSPAPILSNDKVNTIVTEIFQPILAYFKRIGNPYKGVLYAGLMVNKIEDSVKILEFNCRFGDPETQVILPSLKTDLLDLMVQSANGNFLQNKIIWDQLHYLTVVLASPGYPKQYKKKILIENLKNYENNKSWILHAGTETFNDSNDKYYSNGGRVLNVIGCGNNLKEAQKNVYELIREMHLPELFYRNDIGFKALKKE